MASPDDGRIRVAVADAVLGDDGCAARAVAAIAEGGDAAWETAIALAMGWGVLAPLRARIDEPSLPAGVRERLRMAGLALALRSMVVVRRSAEAFEILDAAGIDSVAIKGVGLIAALGYDPARRATGDLDLVVREVDVERVRSVLQAAGFDEINPEYERHMAMIAGSRQLHNFARALRRGDLEVDVHWRFGPHPPPALDAARLIERGMLATLGRRTIRVADPIDAVLINVHHALRGAFTPHNTVRDLFDLKIWWEAPGVAVRLDELVELSTASALAPSLAALWSAILARDSDHPLRDAAARLDTALGAAGRSQSALLRRYFEGHLERGATARFTLELFAPRVYARSITAGVRRAFLPRRPDPPAAATFSPPLLKRPLLVRLAGLGPRAIRIVRELARVREIRSYRAVARAQSRFH